MRKTTEGVTRRAAAIGLLAAPALLRAGPSAAAAPRLGPAEPAFRRLTLGAFEITVLSDAEAMIDGPWPIVGENRPKEEVEALMRANRLPPARFRPGFSPVVVNTGRELVLIDAGNGAEGFVPRPAGGRLLDSLKAAGIAPEDIDVVALTHCHVDHIGGLMEAGAPAFPNARYAVGAREHAFWADDARLGAPEGAVERSSALLFRKFMPPLAAQTTFLKPGDEVAPGIVAVAAHGHTPGHLAYHLESAGQRLLVWGDCAHHEVASLAHPEWSALFDMDKAEGAATRRRVYEMAAAERLPVLGYHTSFPSLGFVERTGSAYRWLPVTYQFAE
ncbi:MBL fold metallo-hydrolase [Methylopila turkensis]|uniref:MBL fold metallo-hydrolase n=1 Tax=Methylopila turkensis TaxID=1437816 RepID=A0A9W6JK88_9HYPH|nr:MBL fold metallo-hydrolase [Methylopila turkensis]GLK78577.1 MBL fold metallo-hydrolase [Methylopila turkensis]